MSEVATHEWWGQLRHDGVLISPQLLDEFFPELAGVGDREYDRLRDAWLGFEAASDENAGRREFAHEVLRTFCDLIGWQKATQVADAFRATSPTGLKLRPDWVLTDETGEEGRLAVTFDESPRLGIGRGKRAYARMVDLLRATGVPFGVLTNGRQFRLVHAGPDFSAWAEWDASAWFDEAEGREQLRGFRTLLGKDSLTDVDAGRGLLSAVQASRHRQGDLAQVLGEQVRQAVEHVIDALDAGLQADPDLLARVRKDPSTGQELSEDAVLAAIYQAATRVVMRLVVLLYAEARELLPRSNELYHGSYGVDGLYQQLTAAAQHAGGPGELADRHTAWPRLLALFSVVHQGSPHQDLPIRDYGGTLFQRGDLDSRVTVLRALSVLQTTGPNDAVVLRILRLLKIGKVKVRKGRSATWVSGPVDFSDLRTEYIGIIYEGLLDFRLKRAPEEDAIVFLNVGRQPALPLSRLDAMSDKQVKDLISELKKDKPAVSVDSDDETAEADDELDETLEEELEEAAADEADDDEVSDETLRLQAQLWAESAVEAANIVRKTKKQSTSEYARQRASAARNLIDRVVGPSRLYLATWGGLRKGTGTFYTRPALAVPTTQRTLEPLCYDRTDDGLRPKPPEEILDLKVCDPAMGSGSFPVAALRYLTDALTDSLISHERIRARADGSVVTLPFGHEAVGEAVEELLPVPLDDDRFETLLRSRLARHVVERCIYGVDINPMAVELARLALWVETMDRELPFEFLDHKLKVGNSLVGAWIHLALDYPAAAWERESGDGKSGEQTKWLRATYKEEVQPELVELLNRRAGADTLPGFGEVEDDPIDTVVDLRGRLVAIHELPTREQREEAYRDFLTSDEYTSLKALLDRWSAVWFWPADPERREPALTPSQWAVASTAVEERIQEVVEEHRFFHWELEFADVFRPDRRGFDAVIGNPPWETVQPESLEFFSSHDPLYRTYGKQRALRRQKELFEADPSIEADWIGYQAGFKALSNWVKSSAGAFDVSLGRGKAAQQLRDGWEKTRAGRASVANPEHPYRYQGDGKTYTYKLFSEIAYHLLAPGGRLGFVLPSGIWTDKGSAPIRELFLTRSQWEWCYGFENRQKIFPIHSMFKFAPIVVERGGSTDAVQAMFMRHDIGEWERPEPPSVSLDVTDIRRFSPETLSFLELRDTDDLAVVDTIYGDRPLLGEVVRVHGGGYAQELNMTSDSGLFRSLRKLTDAGLLAADADTRDPRVRARIFASGYVPLYEGKSVWLHDPYYLSGRAKASVSRFVERADLANATSNNNWQSARLVFRDIASSTNQRTLVCAVMPPAPHGNKLPSLDGLGEAADVVAGQLGSLVLDYVIRMKITTALNWFYVETLPIAVSDPSGARGAKITQLVRSLNYLGAEYALPSSEPKVSGADRMAARLVLDALVADAYGLSVPQFVHVTTRFPIYDKHAEAFAYPKLAAQVYRAFCEGGLEAAEARADELMKARAAAGHGFGLDEVYVPEGGWEQANAEARAILEAG